MRFAILLSVVASSASAFTVPKGQAPGVYSVEIINGTQVHTPLSTKPVSAKFRHRVAARKVPVALIERQDDDAITCGDVNNGASWEPSSAQNDFNNAISELANQCDDMDNVVPSQRSWYSNSGLVVVSFCNYASGVSQCSSEALEKIMDAIDQKCMNGDLTSGASYNIDGGTFYYGVGHTDTDFCPGTSW